MATPVDDRLAGTALLIDRALRVIEDGARTLRQKLLARRLARSIPPGFLVPQASHEEGLSADDLRENAARIRREHGL
jgi:hypothetical protein